MSVSPFKSDLLSRRRDVRSRRTMGQFVQSEALTEESDRGRVKPPRVWWWLEPSLTQTTRQRMTTCSAWRVCLRRLSSHNEMALWIILMPWTCARNDTSKHMRTQEISLHIFQPMSYKVCNYKGSGGDTGSLCLRGIRLVYQSVHKNSRLLEKWAHVIQKNVDRRNSALFSPSSLTTSASLIQML